MTSKSTLRRKEDHASMQLELACDRLTRAHTALTVRKRRWLVQRLAPKQYKSELWDLIQERLHAIAAVVEAQGEWTAAADALDKPP
jgi:hypothetical protein